MSSGKENRAGPVAPLMVLYNTIPVHKPGALLRGTNSTYEIHVGRSRNITVPYFDAEGVDIMTDGGTLFLKSKGAFIGPGHAGLITEKGADWFSCHFYDGTRRGMATLAILPLQWHTNGWPQIRYPS